MNAKSPSPKSQLVPDSLAIAEALQRSAPLSQLRLRLADSNARFAAIEPALPAALRPHVAPGPVDENGWTLLATNSSVAAKLRQLQPRLQDALQERGWQGSPIRIKVQSR